MTVSVSLSTIDRQSNPTSTRHDVIDAASDPQIQTLTDAWDGVIIGAAIKSVKTEDSTIDAGSALPATSKLANRGDKWLYRAQVTNGNIYTGELGTADFTHLPASDSDVLDLTAGVGLALKNAFDAIYQGPNGLTGVLLTVQQVTRTD